MDAVNRRLGEPSGRDERRGYGWPAAVVGRATVRDLPPPYVIPGSTRHSGPRAGAFGAVGPSVRRDDGRGRVVAGERAATARRSMA